MRGELHAIAEVDSNEDNSQKASGPNDILSSDGSLSGMEPGLHRRVPERNACARA